MSADEIVIVGAGIGGLSAALLLAAKGRPVTVVERAQEPGGKLAEAAVGNARIDSGPTVFTLRRVFEEIFAAAGEDLDAYVTTTPANILARHAWSEREQLDLFADHRRSVEAIGQFAGKAEARRYQAFCAEATRIYRTLEHSFIQQPQPSFPGMIGRIGWRNTSDLLRLNPYVSLWKALGKYFHDERLRQLFGRYATYCGSSPFQAPATLMLIAHVELDGVWMIEGGMKRLAEALQTAAERHGAVFRFGEEVREIVVEKGRASGVALKSGERLRAGSVLVNADSGALGHGILGREASAAAPRVPIRQRSLSAVTLSMLARTDGFPLVRHNVFFCRNYEAEFRDIFQRARVPTEPTTYVCAQDRDDSASINGDGSERMLCIINAPPTGDRHTMSEEEIDQCKERTFSLLARCGLSVRSEPEAIAVSTPAHFEKRFPGTGGAIYGAASHGWRASFNRPGCRTKIPGLYLAGGSVHPGPGVPMVAMSGQMAADCILSDSASTGRSYRAVTPGGTSTR
ncbi:1-hydroxycarotenoid 3,4-desaturase CrtD [Dichotomicrobium thermohalophilum]|uniref:1-hydroxycarotenoid 3,4-desaturase n=1 Tax=Dichotomicrobium thermohalophilum TaxID=933063 RepID=A0A397Q643_9HYPH|nr:1-hydroxycarotenoid 3,4-desaturase CrtD [Dichotomicrobium thermohalophilum]RIA56736.1 1-hydroxycarotenoid 3,4-desaturase [Dichotomicrobium thermohalophilum]